MPELFWDENDGKFRVMNEGTIYDIDTETTHYEDLPVFAEIGTCELDEDIHQVVCSTKPKIVTVKDVNEYLTNYYDLLAKKDKRNELTIRKYVGKDDAFSNFNSILMSLHRGKKLSSMNLVAVTNSERLRTLDRNEEYERTNYLRNIFWKDIGLNIVVNKEKFITRIYLKDGEYEIPTDYLASYIYDMLTIPVTSLGKGLSPNLLGEVRMDYENFDGVLVGSDEEFQAFIGALQTYLEGLVKETDSVRKEVDRNLNHIYKNEDSMLFNLVPERIPKVKRDYFEFHTMEM